jgi:hypothetical protein
VKSAALHFKKTQKKHENIACAKPQVKHQIFVGPMAKTQLLKITKRYVIKFDKKTQKLTHSQTLSKLLTLLSKSLHIHQMESFTGIIYRSPNLPDITCYYHSYQSFDLPGTTRYYHNYQSP